MYRTPWNEYVQRRVPVTIKPAKLEDLPVWAVTVDEDSDFWLDAVPDLQEALAFCREHGLPCRIKEDV